MNWDQHYVIDWDKVATFEDMKSLIKALKITFEIDNNNIIEGIKHLLRREDKGDTVGRATMD